MKVLKCSNEMDETTMKNIATAVNDISEGKLVVYPTETVYGITTDVFNQKAVKNLYLTKKRPFDMPLTVAVSEKDMVETIAIMTSPVEKLIDAFLPGPLTIITKKNPNVPDIVTSMSQKVGIRIPDNKIAIELIKQLNGPIISTSANLHSYPDSLNIEMATKNFGNSVDIYLDNGQCTLGKPSTIVWVTDNTVEIIRQGKITQKQIEDVLNA